jgi:DnaK suppressor protein
MDEDNKEYFRKLLLQERNRVLQNAVETVNHDLAFSTDDMPDEGDLATALRNQEMTLRLRDREKYLLSKIHEALKRIDDDEFGECEMCGDDIERGRLEVRPVATLCIECKEFQERQERNYADPRRNIERPRSQFRDELPPNAEEGGAGGGRRGDASLSDIYDEDAEADADDDPLMDLDDAPEDVDVDVDVDEDEVDMDADVDID